MKLGHNSHMQGAVDFQDRTSLTTLRPQRPQAPAAPPELPAQMGPRHLPKGEGNAKLNEQLDHPAFHALLAKGGPIALQDLPEELLYSLELNLHALAKGLVQSPHPGLREGVFDFAKLYHADRAQQTALVNYLNPGFVRRPLEDKAAGIEAIADLLLPGGLEALRRFHLALPFSADSQAKPLTYSMEAEAGLAGRPETLDYYAPDPSGKLDPRALTDDFLESLRFRGTSAQAWMRMTPAQQRDKLRWQHLPSSLKLECLKNYKDLVDERVPLRRITDPKLAPNNQPLPETLCETLLWEGSPLRCAEIVSETYAPTLDVLFADVDRVARIAEKQPGFHIHQVMELSTPEDVKRLGPKVTALAALEDLRIFTKGVRRGSNLPTHTHLEVWQAEGIEEVARSLAEGRIDADAIGIHKFHCVGMRQGIYGDDKRLGIEIRAVRVGENQELAQVAQRSARILAEGHLELLPTPPWGSWNAGKEGIEDAYEAKLRAAPELAEHFEGAQLSFKDVLEVSSGSNPKRDAWKFACPFWAFEKLPGVTKQEAARIEAARKEFAIGLAGMSQTMSQAMEAGREIGGELQESQLYVMMSQFMQDTGVDSIIERALERAAQGQRP